MNYFLVPLFYSILITLSDGIQVFQFGCGSLVTVQTNGVLIEASNQRTRNLTFHFIGWCSQKVHSKLKSPYI